MIAKLNSRLEDLGMFVRGGFHIKPADKVPGRGKTLLLVGNAGSEMFDVMQSWKLDEDHAMDCWSEQTLTKLAIELEADVLFPFGGPPWHPFQQWAKRAELTFPSPIQMLIHPKYGLWHAYRAALVFDGLLDLPEMEGLESPCEGCGRPCRDACPVNAFSDDGYDVDRCAAHMQTPDGVECRQNGCLARRACPVGPTYRYYPAHSNFHMEAFIKAR